MAHKTCVHVVMTTSPSHITGYIFTIYGYTSPIISFKPPRRPCSEQTILIPILLWLVLSAGITNRGSQNKERPRRSPTAMVSSHQEAQIRSWWFPIFYDWISPAISLHQVWTTCGSQDHDHLQLSGTRRPKNNPSNDGLKPPTWWPQPAFGIKKAREKPQQQWPQAAKTMASTGSQDQEVPQRTPAAIASSCQDHGLKRLYGSRRPTKNPSGEPRP